MNTHDKYELPPLPEHDMCGEAYAYSNDAMQTRPIIHTDIAIQTLRAAIAKATGETK